MAMQRKVLMTAELCKFDYMLNLSAITERFTRIIHDTCN